MPRHSPPPLPAAPGRRVARRLAARARGPRGDSPCRPPALREATSGTPACAATDSSAPASALSISSWYAISGTAMA